MDIQSLFSVSGKYVLVTGGGRGIGRMIAEGFSRNGATVFISSRTQKQCDDAAVEMNANASGGGRVIALPAMDLGTMEGVKKLALDLRASLKQLRGVEALDVLVHNSGISWGEEFSKFSEKGWDRVMDLNVKAVFFLTQALAPLLVEASSLSKGHASIITVGSIAGLHNQPFPTFSYDTSKAAVHHLTRHFAAIFAANRITCNSLAPGLVPSKMSNQLKTYLTHEQLTTGIPLGRVGKPTDMAGLCIYFASKAGEWTTGVTVQVDGGATVGGRSFDMSKL